MKQQSSRQGIGIGCTNRHRHRHNMIIRSFSKCDTYCSVVCSSVVVVVDSVRRTRRRAPHTGSPTVPALHLPTPTPTYTIHNQTHSHRSPPLPNHCHCHCYSATACYAPLPLPLRHCYIKKSDSHQRPQEAARRTAARSTVHGDAQRPAKRREPWPKHTAQHALKVPCSY